MKIALKIGLYFLLILLMLFLAVLCYSAMSGVQLLVTKIETLILDDSWKAGPASGEFWKNVGFWALRFFVNGFKYAIALYLMYAVFRALWHFKSVYMALQIAVFVIFSLALVIVGPDVKYLIHFKFVKAYENSILVNYIASFGKLRNIGSIPAAVTTITDIIMVSLYYIGAIVKPVRSWIKWHW